jgi:poly(A) polymerase
MKIDNYGKWQAIIDKIRKVSSKNGLDTYIVGGFVRDLLLGRSPKDLDIMVDGEGAGMKLAELLYEEYGGHAPVLFPRFGTAKLTMDGEDVEFVAPRKEFYEQDSRKPTTVKGDLWDDAMRRDFSVNALFIDLKNNEVLDLTGNGINDIKNKVLRVADEKNPDIIMTQDPLRMMRLVRQSSQLGFSIDKSTYDAVVRNAAKINTISKERIQEELNKILLTDKPSTALKFMKETGLLKYISPELDALESTEEESEYATKNVWAHTVQVVDQSPKNLTTRLAALLHDVAKPKTMSRTYIVTCDNASCGTKGQYVFKSQPEIGIVCENCGNKKVYKNEQELRAAFPSYRIHFYDHEKVGSTSAKKILSGLKYPQDVIDRVSNLVLHHMRPHAYNENEWTDSSVRRLRRETDPFTDELLDLTSADVTSNNPNKKKRNVDRIQNLRNRIKKLEEVMPNSLIRSPLDGNELMAMFPEKKAGPWLSEYKELLINEIIEGRMAPDDKGAATRFVQALQPRISQRVGEIKISARDK